MRCEDKGRLPVLGDFYELLLDQEEPEARDIALRYERYVKGALSFSTTRATSASKTASQRGLQGPLAEHEGVRHAHRPRGVRNRMYANFERGVTTWLYIDEVQSLFGHPAIISYFSKFWAEGRKFNLICTGITQNSTYMLEHEDARNMVLNSDFVLLHKQSHLDRKSWVDLLALSAQEEATSTTPSRPARDSWWREACACPSRTTSRRARSTTCSTPSPRRSPR